MKKTRLCGIDIVRIIAISSVILLHAISSVRSFEAPLDMTEVFYLYLRNLAMAAVPLFLLITGYLQKNKTFTLAYYRGIIPVGMSYLVISILSLVTDKINGMVEFNIVTAIIKILDFSANGYAWYFEMYIGLFLIVPFLNMVYRGINTKSGKIALIAILSFLTLFPDTVVGFSPYYDGHGGTIALNIIPDFFKSLYPITYYFIGSFISEYKPKMNFVIRIALAVAAPLLPTLTILWFSNSRASYAWYLFNGFQTIPVCLTAVAVFLAFYNTDIRFGWIKKGISVVAECAFEMYLVSYIVDNYVYLIRGVEGGKALNSFLTVLAVSFVAALIIHNVLKPINKLIIWVYDKAIGGSKNEL